MMLASSSSSSSGNGAGENGSNVAAEKANDEGEYLGLAAAYSGALCDKSRVALSAIIAAALDTVRRRIYKTVPPKDGESAPATMEEKNEPATVPQLASCLNDVQGILHKLLAVVRFCQDEMGLFKYAQKMESERYVESHHLRAHMHKVLQSIRHNITNSRTFHFEVDAAVGVLAGGAPPLPSVLADLVPQRAISATAGATDPTDASGSLLTRLIIAKMMAEDVPEGLEINLVSGDGGSGKLLKCSLLGKFTVLLNVHADKTDPTSAPDALWVVDTVRIHVRAAGGKSLVTKQHLELLASFLQYEMRNSAENKALVRCVGHLKSFCVRLCLRTLIIQAKIIDEGGKWRDSISIDNVDHPVKRVGVRYRPSAPGKLDFTQKVTFSADSSSDLIIVHNPPLGDAEVRIDDWSAIDLGAFLESVSHLHVKKSIAELKKSLYGSRIVADGLNLELPLPDDRCLLLKEDAATNGLKLVLRRSVDGYRGRWPEYKVMQMLQPRGRRRIPEILHAWRTAFISVALQRIEIVAAALGFPHRRELRTCHAFQNNDALFVRVRSGVYMGFFFRRSQFCGGKCVDGVDGSASISITSSTRKRKAAVALEGENGSFGDAPDETIETSMRKLLCCRVLKLDQGEGVYRPSDPVDTTH